MEVDQITWYVTHIREIVSSKLLGAIIIVFFIGLMFLVVSYFISLSTALSGIIRQFGGVLVASAIVSLVYEHLLRRDFETLLRKQVDRALREALSVVEEVTSLGIERIYRNRADIPWEILFTQARNEIKIIGTSLNYWSGLPEIREALSTALSRGCSIQFLALDPDSRYARERGEHVDTFQDNPQDAFRLDITTSITHLRKISENIDVRLYDAIPTCVVAIVDDRLIVNYLLRGLRGRNSIHIEFRRAADKARDFEEKHYNSVLKISRPAT
jgi:hypothetical protein